MKFVVFSILALLCACASQPPRSASEPPAATEPEGIERNVSAEGVFGRYRPVGTCTGPLKGASSVYIGRDQGRNPGILVRWFTSGDASMMSFQIGEGQQQCPGTSVSIHGVCTEKWKTTQNAAGLVSVVETIMPTRQIHTMETTQLQVNGGSLLYTSQTQEEGKPAKQASCTLQRY